MRQEAPVISHPMPRLQVERLIDPLVPRQGKGAKNKNRQTSFN